MKRGHSSLSSPFTLNWSVPLGTPIASDASDTLTVQNIPPHVSYELGRLKGSLLIIEVN
jgi:hypothetical protein